jgi:predicted nucleic acid-binding protein
VNGFLLDTNVLSMFSPLRSAHLPAAFGEWRDRQTRANAIYLSAMSVHEIEKGAHLLLLKEATRQASVIQMWLLGLTAGFGDSILPLDAGVATLSGQLEALAISSGHSPGAADAVIAGTAKAHDLTVITHNVKHFLPFAIPVISPDQLAP